MELISHRKLNKSWTNTLFVLVALTTAFIWYFQACRMPMEIDSFIDFSQPALRKLSVANQGEFSVITYNIAGLPQVICSAITERNSSIAEIGRRLNGYDVAHVQEDFNYNSALYYEGNNHPYKTKTKGTIPFGDGLNTLSRFPIVTMRRIPWMNCSGADCLTPKGFTYSKIELANEVYVDFYNVHANAADDPKWLWAT